MCGVGVKWEVRQVCVCGTGGVEGCPKQVWGQVGGGRLRE